MKTYVRHCLHIAMRFVKRIYNFSRGPVCVQRAKSQYHNTLRLVVWRKAEKLHQNINLAQKELAKIAHSNIYSSERKTYRNKSRLRGLKISSARTQRASNQFRERRAVYGFSNSIANIQYVESQASMQRDGSSLDTSVKYFDFASKQATSII